MLASPRVVRLSGIRRPGFHPSPVGSKASEYLDILSLSTHELPVLLAAPNRSGLHPFVSGLAYPLLHLSVWSASISLADGMAYFALC